MKTTERKNDVQYMGEVKDENGNPMHHFEAAFGNKKFGDYLFYLNPMGECVRGNKHFIALGLENPEYHKELVDTAVQNMVELGLL